MKYRILKQVRNNDEVCFTPQVKESFWSKWRTIAKDQRGNYAYLPVNNFMAIKIDYILYALPNLTEAIDIIEMYKKMIEERNAQKIKSTSILWPWVK